MIFVEREIEMKMFFKEKILTSISTFQKKTCFALASDESIRPSEYQEWD